MQGVISRTRSLVAAELTCSQPRETDVETAAETMTVILRGEPAWLSTLATLIG